MPPYHLAEKFEKNKKSERSASLFFGKNGSNNMKIVIVCSINNQNKSVKLPLKSLKQENVGKAV